MPAHQTIFVQASVLLTAAAIHGVVIGLLLIALTARRPEVEPARAAPPRAASRLVFIVSPVPGGGGGGGGGNRQPARLPRLQKPGHDARTTPPVPAPTRSSPTLEAPAPQATLLDAVPLSSASSFVIGLPNGAISDSVGQGPGEGGGIGTGSGTGIGGGRGPGIGPGAGGGTGGGVYQVGGGVSAPTVLRQVRPSYTTDAIRAKIQGAVLLELVVRSDGTPDAIRVVRSLDPGGLDQQAIEAVRQWRFIPGRRGGQPVDVLVSVIMDFSLR